MDIKYPQAIMTNAKPILLKTTLSLSFGKKNTVIKCVTLINAQLYIKYYYRQKD